MPDRFEGEFVRKIYDNGDGFIIAVYANKDTKITAKGDNLPMIKDLPVVLEGNLQYVQRYEENQLSVETFEIKPPKHKNGMVAYFLSLKVGIGKKIAEAIWAEFGQETWDIMEQSPERLLAVKGMTERKLHALEDKMAESQLLRELMKVLSACEDITQKKAQKIIEEFGPDSVEIVQHDPFSICEIEGFGFVTVDKLARSMQGLNMSDKKRIVSCYTYLLNEYAAKGHVCFPAEHLIKDSHELLNNGFQAEQVTEERCRVVLQAETVAGQFRITNGMVYSKKRYNQEVDTARHLMRIHGRGEIQPVDKGELQDYLLRYGADNGINLAENQVEAVYKSSSSLVSIITGGPGTGKTTIVKALLAVHQEQWGDSAQPLLLAPTGRAARRLKEATGNEAMTVHAAIQYRGERNGEAMLEDEEQCLEATLIIIDESSMLDQMIAAALLQKIPTNTQLVFVGDADQLPSVGAGNVLHELIRSGEFPTTKLDVIFRQAQDNPIVANAARIRMGRTDLVMNNQFKLFEIYDSESIIKKACDFYALCVKHFGMDSVVLLNPTRKKSDISVNALNKILQDRLNPKDTSQLSMKSREIEFRIKDKVMQLKNIEEVKNGDIGYIMEIYDESTDDGMERYCRVEFEDGTEVIYSQENLSQLDLAYCTTIHKAQGSEYQTVIIICTKSHYYSLRRNLVYTGITRAVQHVAIIGQRSAVERAINNNMTDKRHTMLADRIHHLAKKLRAEYKATG